MLDDERQWLEEIAHEFRNPLTILQHGLELVRESPAQADQLYEMLGSEVKRMQRLVANLLNITHIARGHYPIQKDIFNAEVFLARCVQYFKIHHPSILIEVHCDIGAMCADPDLLKQILDNLITNAIKHLPEKNGKIEIWVKKRKHRNQNQFVIEILDNGVGIQKSDLARVFERYRQSGKQAVRKKGIGIGLSIVQQAVQLHGGRIWIESEYGQWTKVQFSLPVPESPSRILIIGQGSPILPELSAWLPESKAHIKTVLTGKDGITALSKEVWDLIFVDVDGLEMEFGDLLGFLLAAEVPLVYVRDETRVLPTHSAISFIEYPLSPTRLAESIRSYLPNLVEFLPCH